MTHRKEFPVINDLNSTAPPKSDAELVRLAREGNEDAFAALYSAHKTKVYSICLRMTSNTAEAEDLTQAAFLQVFRKLESFRGDSALSTWLYRVAVNTVLMHFRKKGLRQVSLDEPANRETGAPKREQGKVDDRLSSSIDRIMLTRAMKELPAGYRTIFLLHEVKGYEHHEIARLLHCSVGNSKSQLHKAKARMRELLRQQKAQNETPAASPRTRALQNPATAEPIFRQPLESQSWESASEAAA
jgi:RNA polymerase sigma-70 factor (ECF subfamily)